MSFPHPHSSLSEHFLSRDGFAALTSLPQGHLAVVAGRVSLLASVRLRPAMLPQTVHRVGHPSQRYPARVSVLGPRNLVLYVTITNSFLHVIPEKNSYIS